MIGAMITLILFVLGLVLEIFLRSLVFPTPISDTKQVRYGTFPGITILLIFINGVVFAIFQASNYYQGILTASSGNLGEGTQLLYQYVVQVWTYGYREIFVHESVGIGALSVFTSMFMHADMWHLIGNMIALWTFGRRVEDICGPWRYLLFYLLSGMIAIIGWDVLTFQPNDLPGIGASGAIAGVMGAYLILFPGALILCFWGIGIVLRLPVVAILKLAGVKAVEEARLWRWTFQMPAWIFLILWLVMNTLPSLEQIAQPGISLGGVNTIAHMTGFLGALLIFFFVRKGVVTRYFAGRSL